MPTFGLFRLCFGRPAEPTDTPRSKRHSRLRLLVLLLLLLVVGEGLRVTVGPNTHTLLDGRVYRSAQLSPERLKRHIEKHGIRTVINLRGNCYPFDWYIEQSQTTHDLNVSQEDITLSANRLPPPNEMRRLLEVLDRTEYPILVHCKQGADRTGLVSALILLLQTDADLPTAKSVCSPRYGHIGIGRTRAMDRFFELYEEYLAQRNLAHSPDHLRNFLRVGYVPDAYVADLEYVEFPTNPRVGEGLKPVLRLHNRSLRAWEFKPGTGTGTHVRYIVYDPLANTAAIRRAGLFRATVPVGASIDIALPIPPFRKAGTFILQADVIHSDDEAFSQIGSEPLLQELRIGE